MDKLQEEWRDIAGFEGLYQISNLGRVKSLSRRVDCKGCKYQTVRKRFLKPMKLGEYLSVTLSHHGKRKHKLIHRLVAESFMPVEDSKLGVHHIDGDKHNNIVSNLKWDTHSENVARPYRMGLIIPKSHKRRKVIITFIDGKKIICESVASAAKTLMVSKSLISQYCNCKVRSKRVKNYRIRFYE